MGLSVDEYAQLRRYAKEAFRSEVNIRVHRCTQLAHSTLERLVESLYTFLYISMNAYLSKWCTP